MTAIQTPTIRFWREEHSHPRAALIGAVLGAVLWSVVWGFAAYKFISYVVDVRSPRALLALCFVWASRDYVTAGLAELIAYNDRLFGWLVGIAKRGGIDTGEAERLKRALR